MQLGRRPNAPRFWPQQPRRRSAASRLLFVARPFVLAGILFLIWAGADPVLIDPPAFLTSDSERVSAQFTRCGPGRAFACVIDGDTFKLGRRKVRIIGIDAPETHNAGCAEEARLGEQATARLQQLLNQGPFDMVAPVYGRQDRYGRDLRTIRRTLPDGTSRSIAEEMRESGLAHRYMGGFKLDWC